MKTVAYIHGFNSSPRSFAFLTSLLPEHHIIPVSYNSHQPLSDSIEECLKQLPKGNVNIVGHSLGGVIGTLIAADHPQLVKKLITISSPLGGSRAATALRWMPGYPAVFASITPTSAPIRAIQQVRLRIPTLSIISTGGHLPTTSEPNDSVVTVRSQKALGFGEKLIVPATHFEVLLHEKTVEAIRNHIFGG